MICSISHLVWCWVILHYSRTILPSFSKHPSQGCFMDTWRTGDTNISSCSKSLPLFVLPLCPKEMRLFLELLRRNWWRLHSLTGLNLLKKSLQLFILATKAQPKRLSTSLSKPMGRSTCLSARLFLDQDLLWALSSTKLRINQTTNNLVSLNTA